MAQARIYRPAATPTQSGRKRMQPWILEFHSQSRRHRDPLMGWTGFDDTRSSQVRLRFTSREEAVAYAKRAELSYDVQESNEKRAIIKPYAANFITHRRHNPVRKTPRALSSAG